MNRPSISPTSGPVLPTLRAGPVAYRLIRAVLGRAVRLMYRVEVDGLDRVPEDGPVILAANHLSFMDSIFLVVTNRRPIAFVAKAEYFEHRGRRALFSATGQIPLQRGSPAGARRTMAAAAEVLANDGTIGIYPEGTRSRDGQLHRGHRGPALLALGNEATIVPVGLIGTDAIQPPGQRLPRPFKTVRVRYGHPRHVHASEIRGTKAARVREVTDEVMHDIAALSGQHYVDEYTPLSTARRREAIVLHPR